MEVWKNIKGYEGFYMISNLGNIKSLDRTIFNKGSNRNTTIKGTILKTRQNPKNGYLEVGLHKENKRKLYYIHRLVALHFIDNLDCLQLVNHKDGDKTNNYYTNLEWCDLSENSSHAYRIGLNEPQKVGAIKRSVYVYNKTKLVGRFESISSASKYTNVSETTIRRVLKNEQKISKGFIFSEILLEGSETIERIS